MVLYYQLNEATMPCRQGGPSHSGPASCLLSQPIFYLHILLVLPNSLTTSFPVPGMLFPSCKRYFLHILQVSSKTIWSWQSNLLPSHLLPDNAWDVTSPPPAPQKKTPHSASTVIGTYFYLYLFLPIAWFWIPVFLPPVRGQPSKEGTFDQFCILCI